jgi:chromosome segregation ATPase
MSAAQGGVPLDAVVERQARQIGLLSTQLTMRDIAMEADQARTTELEAELEAAQARIAELEAQLGDADADTTDEPATDAAPAT